MQSGRLWRAVVAEIGKAEYPDVELQHMYADNCAMQLCARPKQFDVILGSNLFGDVLSDLAAALTGSLGMLPSATLGAPGRTGRATPSTSRSTARRPTSQARASPTRWRKSCPSPCCCAWSFGMEEDAKLIETAIEKVLAGGLRTADIMQPGMARVGTGVMGEALLRELDKLAA
jgi:3-isopropylmalate dehydrogenase